MVWDWISNGDCYSKSIRRTIQLSLESSTLVNIMSNVYLSYSRGYSEYNIIMANNGFSITITHIMKTTATVLPYVARAYHPWETLKDYLNAKKLTQRQFAKLIDKKPNEVNYIVKWKRDITTDLAIRIWAFFETWPEVWLWLQRTYDIYRLRKQKENEDVYQLILKRGQEYKKD